ncbi:RNA polymerase sigma factor [Nonomuraea sp. NPDC050540]|uniref:RNA polymerase sigma factor n=1 Tax=Nonomuraea sp. NPDC050540 TaxID=3364367 RepID=UPI0037B866F2
MNPNITEPGALWRTVISVEPSLRVRLRAGDHDAFSALFDEFAQQVYAHAYRLTGDWSTAEDVTAATFGQAWRSRRKIQTDGGTLRPWLLGIATNLARAARRGERRRRALADRLPPDALVPDFADQVADRAAAAAQIHAVRQAFDRLRRPEQDVVALCVWAGLDYEQAAQAPPPQETARPRRGGAGPGRRHRGRPAEHRPGLRGDRQPRRHDHRQDLPGREPEGPAGRTPGPRLQRDRRLHPRGQEMLTPAPLDNLGGRGTPGRPAVRRRGERRRGLPPRPVQGRTGSDRRPGVHGPELLHGHGGGNQRPRLGRTGHRVHPRRLAPRQRSEMCSISPTFR